VTLPPPASRLNARRAGAALARIDAIPWMRRAFTLDWFTAVMLATEAAHHDRKARAAACPWWLRWAA
jgi:hypothetical protein